jgi:hypothetical protein
VLPVTAAILAGACLAARPAAPAEADPPVEAGRTAFAAMLATDASRLLADLQAALDAAIEHGREGTARTVAGDAPPEPEYLAAAEALTALAPGADDAAIAVGNLAAVIRALDPQRSVTRLPPGSGELLGIAAQLRESAQAAGPFVATRMASEGTLAALAQALADIQDGDLPAALAALDRAAEARGVVAAWENPPATLPFWLETSDDMIVALERLVTATSAGDDAGVAQATADYADAAEEAHQADLALAISLSETGSDIARTPLRRLTAYAAAVSEALEAAASVSEPP